MKYKLRRHIDFINENDNIQRAERGLDRFGMTNYDALPDEVKNKAIEVGMKNSDSYGREGISTKSCYEYNLFSEEEGYENSMAAIWISADGEDYENFTAESALIFSIDMIGKHDFNMEIVRTRYDYEDIMKMLNLIPDLKREMEILTSGFKRGNESRNKMLMKQFLRNNGIRITNKDHIGYYGGLS